MALVKLEIDGKRIIAVDNQTILAVARENGIGDIPTLCHDEQLEPFTSCYVCVVKVKGARSLLPACSTKVTDGMVVETESPEVRRSRKAAIELLLSSHNADCVGPCQQACPAGVDIQGYVALAALGRFREAIQLIKEKHPLPAICGRVCTRPCEVTGCRRSLLDSPVGIDNIKRFVADIDLGDAQPYRPAVAPPNGKRVAIVGAGPGGLASAFYLAKGGYDVHLFEAQPEAGGMLRYGIPEYRLPKEVLDSEIGQILDLGVKLSTNVALGRDFTVSSLKNQGFDAVFLALGAWESSAMRVKNENVAGVLPGIEFLKNVGLRRKVEVSGKTIVVGGGNTAIDCARTALRLGAGEVTLLYRRTRAEMPANSVEIDEAEREGVKLVFLAAPTEVIAKDGRLTGLRCVRMELGAPDASGRRSPKPIKGSEFSIPCDFAIAAIGQSTTMRQLVGSGPSQFVPEGETLKLTRSETVQIDGGTFETTVEGVFAGGDVVTGAATVVEAVAAGRKAAWAIDRYITTGKATPEPESFISRRSLFGTVTAEDLRSMERIPRRHMPVLATEDRMGSFAEVELGYALDDVNKESARCLECGCAALFTCELRALATRYNADAKHYLGEAKQVRLDRTHPLIELDANKCILCGRCIRMCSETVGVSAFGFVNRGFNTLVRPALGESLLDTDCVSCGLCIGTCPTGAITPVLPLAKPGPWVTTVVPSVCHFCGVGCEIELQAHGDTFITPSRVERSRTTLGNHCKKGRFGFEYVQAPDRALSAGIRTGRDFQRTTLEDAIQYTGMRLKELSAKVRPEEMAVLVSPRFTNEEIYLAQKLARVVLGTHNVSSFATLMNPEFFYPEVVSTATYADLVGAQTIVVVGAEPDEEHFTVDLLVKRAIRNGARLLCVGSPANRTTRVADLHLACKPGSETQVLLAIAKALAQEPGEGAFLPAELQGLADQKSSEELAVAAGVSTEEVQQAALLLAGSVARVVVFNKDWRGPRAPQDERLYAAFARALGASTLALRERSNMQGLLDMGAHPAWFPGYLATDDATAITRLEREWNVALRDMPRPKTDLLTEIAEKRIKVAIVLGEDPLGSGELPESVQRGLRGLDFLVVGDLFMTPTAEAAQVFLPLSSAVETEGTFTNHERRIQRVQRSIPPRNGMENWQIFCQLAARMGGRFRMKYQSPADVWAEIRRVVPIYKGVSLDRPNLDAVWDLAQFPLAPVPPTPSADGSLRQPRRTSGLDTLDRRFERRIKDLFERARQARASNQAQAISANGSSPG
jgi:Uncharacterized anaerobic dehydrogenase